MGDMHATRERDLSISAQASNNRSGKNVKIPGVVWMSDAANITEDYTWHENKRVAQGCFRPLRVPKQISGLGVPKFPFSLVR